MAITWLGDVVAFMRATRIRARTTSQRPSGGEGPSAPTGGNFRLIERLMSQVARVLEINQLDIITPDVVNAARQTLVVGPQ